MSISAISAWHSATVALSGPYSCVNLLSARLRWFAAICRYFASLCGVIGMIFPFNMEDCICVLS